MEEMGLALISTFHGITNALNCTNTYLIIIKENIHEVLSEAIKFYK
jgi:hypothetical protein